MTGFIKRRIVTSETLGERLRKVREGRDLSFKEVEMAISIKTDYLECLEGGDYSDLPGEVYIKSFLKSYGSFLGLNEDEVAEQYERERKIDDYKMMVEHAAKGRDLFGNKTKKDFHGLGWRRVAKEAMAKSFLRNIVLSQIFMKGVAMILILGLLLYLGVEVREMIRPPDLTVLKPVDNLVTNENEIEVLGIVEIGAVLTVNDSEVVYDEKGRFEEVIDLREGMNEIEIGAKKKHSREAVEVRRVMVR